MFELKKNFQICNGEKSCGLCCDHLPRFFERDSGHLLISPSNFTKNHDKITAALEVCPTMALTLQAMPDHAPKEHS